MELGHGRSVAYVQCVSTQCLHCQKVIVGDSAFMAVGEPYCGVLHPQCAPFYAYPASWPHLHPAVRYLQGP